METIVRYLRNGKKTYSATSRAYDFFTKEVIADEHCGMADGVYTWNVVMPLSQAKIKEKFRIWRRRTQQMHKMGFTKERN